MAGERRTSEFRLDGRTLIGTAIRYGDMSPGHRERFQAGAFAPLPASLSLNLQHDEAREIANTRGGLVVQDSAVELSLRAELREGSAELNLVRRKALNGLSVEFTALQESRDNGIRVIERAELSGIGLVDMPSYPASRIELRRGSGTSMRSFIPSNRPAACDCAGDAACRWAEFADEALQEMWSEVQDKTRELVATYGDYKTAVASTQRGTVRLEKPVTGGMAFEIDLPDSEAGRAVRDAHEAAGVVVRPFIDTRADVQATAVAMDNGEQKMVYTRAPVRALIISATDARSGWPAPTLITTPEIPEKRAVRPARRRHWL